MSRILYHALSRSSVDASPFDESILKIATTAHVRIVSPYIGISYLERVIECAESWLLVSDIEAWLSSLSLRARPRAWSFIRANLDKIHHCEGIHAKAVIGNSMAMFGSANLTETGILSRTELGVFLDDVDQVAELQRWFDGLWEQTFAPFVDETNAFVTWLDEEASKSVGRRQKFALAPESRQIRAKLIRVEPRRNPPVRAELNLDCVAKEIVRREELHYTSLHKSLEEVLDTLAAGGFSLGDALIEVRRRMPSATVREVYYLLVQHCANHPRSVFVEGTVNRLVLSDSRRFIQSDKDRLEVSLRKFDHYLVKLLQSLEFDTPNDLPIESEIEAETGIAERDQFVLVGELIEAGFLSLHDLPGEIPLYELAEDFDWTGRFRFFQRARMAWNALLSTPRQHLGGSNADKDDSDDFTEELPSVFEEQRALRHTKREEAQRLAIKDETLGHSKRGDVGQDRGTFSPTKHSIDEAKVRLIEWIMSSPCGQRMVPVERPGRFLAKELNILPQMTSTLLFGNPLKRFVAISDEVDGLRTITLKPINLKFVEDFPLTKGTLEKYGLLGRDDVLQ